MTLLELLSKNERILVWSDEGNQTLYTWNQSLTLQAWSYVGRGEGLDNWEEVAIMTLSSLDARCGPSRFEAARNRARHWALEGE